VCLFRRSEQPQLAGRRWSLLVHTREQFRDGIAQEHEPLLR
jgi:hypothetical protein